MGNVTISREEYDSLICLKDRVQTLKNMVVQAELTNWEQLLLLLGDMDMYMEYCRNKEA